MKKFFIAAFIAILAISSCSKDEVKEVNKGSQIGFQASTKTKGIEAEAWTMETIYVTALNQDGTSYFTKVPFVLTGNGTDGYYSTSPAYYWPGDGRAFDFYAYTPSETELGGAIEINGTTKKLTGFTTSENILNQYDFVTAIANDQTENENGSSTVLTFSHNLASIDLRARSSNNSYEYIIKGVRIANIKQKGDFNFESSEWDLSKYNNIFTANMEIQEPITLRDEISDLLGEVRYKDDDEYNYAFVLPQEVTSWDPTKPTAGGSYISVNIQINKRNSDGSKTRIYPDVESDYGWVAVPLPVNTVWEAGNRYNYTLVFGKGAGYSDPTEGGSTGNSILGDAIKFKMDVTEWGDSEEDFLKNIEMIGKWTATGYYELVESDQLQDDDTYAVVEQIQNETTDLETISGYVNNFATITIKDGTKLITTNINGVQTETPYILDENRYILIEVYIDRDGQGNPIVDNEGNVQYVVYPQIHNITQAISDPYQKGSAEIHVVQNNSGTQGTGDYYKRTQVILYDIEPLSINNN